MIMLWLVLFRAGFCCFLTSWMFYVSIVLPPVVRLFVWTASIWFLLGGRVRCHTALLLIMLMQLLAVFCGRWCRADGCFVYDFDAFDGCFAEPLTRMVGWMFWSRSSSAFFSSSLASTTADVVPSPPCHLVLEFHHHLCCGCSTSILWEWLRRRLYRMSPKSRWAFCPCSWTSVVSVPSPITRLHDVVSLGSLPLLRVVLLSGLGLAVLHLLLLNTPYVIPIY